MDIPELVDDEEDFTDVINKYIKIFGEKLNKNSFDIAFIGDTPYDLAVYYGWDEIAELLKDHMIRKIQNKQLRRMTRRRARTMRRLATAKSMLTDGNSTLGNPTFGNPMSYMDNDTISYLMSNYLM